MARGMQLNTCIHCRGRYAGSCCDPICSDSKFPTYFCSLNCEKKWVAGTVAKMTLADIVDLQARVSAAAGMAAGAAASGQ